MQNCNGEQLIVGSQIQHFTDYQTLGCLLSHCQSDNTHTHAHAVTRINSFRTEHCETTKRKNHKRKNETFVSLEAKYVWQFVFLCMWDRFYSTSWMLDSKRDNKTKTKVACLLLILFSRKNISVPLKKNQSQQ